MAKKKTIRTIPQERTPMREQDAQVRAKNFEEVACGYSVEDALRESERCLMCPDEPCIGGCPVGINIPGFIQKIGESNFRGAYDILTDTNLLPSICGRVCPQENQCEGVCTVGDSLEAVAIGRLERFVGDTAIKEGWVNIPYIEPNRFRVGIVGSGPAGMACAADMAKAGCDVTVYEAFHQAGGVLKYGIPDFRLPNTVIDAEINNLKKFGVKFECNTLVGRLFTIEQMIDEMGFHAVFVGVGAGYPTMLNIPGDSLNGVLSANELLTRCNLMRARDFPHFDTPLPIGKRVAVVGAGNTAMDAMRVSIRLGAEKVYCIYRRSRTEAPARAEEVHHAEQEGVEYHWLTSPVSVLDDGKGSVRGMRCVRMELGEPDESGRRRPVPVAGSEFDFEADLIVYAIGTNANPIMGQTSKLKLNKWGYIGVDENLATSMAGVFAGGDIVSGAATVIKAMGAGRKAARSMKAYLGIRDSALPYTSGNGPSQALCLGLIRGSVISRAFAFARCRLLTHQLAAQTLNSGYGKTMNELTMHQSTEKPGNKTGSPASKKLALKLKEHIIEIISDSGEGAQKCGQSLGAIAAQMGNGIWTTEIIPAEIRPPARSIAGASGNRIRIGSGYITNGGDETDLVVAFNEQVLLGRVRAKELKPGCTILLESIWRTHADPKIVASYIETHDRVVAAGYHVYEIPMEQECRTIVADAKRGKNMFALGMLCRIYSLELKLAVDQIVLAFGKKDQSVVDANIKLLEAGHKWAQANLDFCYSIPAVRATEPQIVVNGNTALALGVLASGMEICAMYPITPATSASHYLSEVFENVGGMVHQAEDEIAACAFAIGASYAGKCTITITSGPGYSLKQEAIGLAVMGEIPLVVVNVQRGGPSTGQPTKMEQGDLMAAIFGSHGDAPKVVMAPSTIEECFYSIITARKIAETFNMVVVVLSDAGLATSQQPFARPKFSESWMAPPIDQSPVPVGARPYDWDDTTGLARRFIPGQPGGMHTLTGLVHDRDSHVAYDPDTNEESLRARSLKLAALQKTLKAPQVFGDPKGDLLVIGWGSTKGAIEEAVDAVRAEGRKVSSMHLQFLQPLPPGIKEIMQGFKKVMTIESNWSDRPDDQIIDETNRRYSSVAILLRSRYLVDVDCWSEVKGQPIKPGTIRRVMLEQLKK